MVAQNHKRPLRREEWECIGVLLEGQRLAGGFEQRPYRLNLLPWTPPFPNDDASPFVQKGREVSNNKG